MKNPFRHHTHGDTIQTPRVPDTPEELLEMSDMTGEAEDSGDVEGTGGEGHEQPWHPMRNDVDPDCERDPGSDLIASWNLEGAAAEEAREQDERD